MTTQATPDRIAVATLELMRRYAACRGICLTTLGQQAVGSPTVALRLETGRVTLATLARIHQFISDRWYHELEWPQDDIPRPEPRTQDAA